MFQTGEVECFRYTRWIFSMARLFRAGPKLGPFSKRTPERTRAHSSLAPSHVHQTTIPGIQQKTTKKNDGQQQQQENADDVDPSGRN